MLEEKIKRARVASKGWKVKVKKLEADLVAQGSKENDKKSTKKLMDEKDKQIENLKKKLKFSAIDHPQTRDILVFKNKCDELKNEVLDLKSKLLQVLQEKQEMIKK